MALQGNEKARCSSRQGVVALDHGFALLNVEGGMYANPPEGAQLSTTYPQLISPDIHLNYHM